jgi:hypothetical protein
MYLLMRHGSIKSGLFCIIGGALITALPSLVISTYNGASQFFFDQGISPITTGWGLSEVMGFTSNCEGSIPVDMSDYDENNPSFNRLGGAMYTGIPSFAQAGKSGASPIFGGSVGQAQMSESCRAQIGKQLAGGERALKTDKVILRDCVGFRGTNPATGRPSPHLGIDLVPSQHGTLPSVLAVEAGKVIDAHDSASAGKMIVIDHGGGRFTRYFHMSSFAGKMAGTQVGAGEVIGTMGSTGHSTGPHLHLELKENNQNADACSMFGCQ